MRDIQNSQDSRNCPIQKVGVKRIFYPISIITKSGGVQTTTAEISMFVNLAKEAKGTHMSRFIEILNGYHLNINISRLIEINKILIKKLNAKSSYTKFQCKYFITKVAPISKYFSLMGYDCAFSCEIQREKQRQLLEVHVPVTSVCPCSKEISEFGAHNQRGNIRVTVLFENIVWIEDIVQLVEASVGCEVYSLLKRTDEKFVTEKAYQNPMFVEDMVREVYLKVQKMENVLDCSVEAENFESIHNHSAYALIDFRSENEE